MSAAYGHKYMQKIFWPLKIHLNIEKQANKHTFLSSTSLSIFCILYFPFELRMGGHNIRVRGRSLIY